MSLTVNQRIQLKITRQLVGLGLFMGLLYILITFGFSDPQRFFVGAVSGICLGALISYYELVLFKRGAKRIRFIWLLLLRGLIYFLSIVLIIGMLAALARASRWNMSFAEVVVHPDYYDGYLIHGDFVVAVVYCMVIAFSVNFVRMISRKMGQGVLISYITGTYYSPVHQARIIMFISLRDAERVLQKLGPKRYFSFLNDLFYDYSIPVVKHRGIVYEYVEDLAVITWSVDKGLNEANAIKAFYNIQGVLDERAKFYLEQYGCKPDVCAALHIGSVVRSEIGEVKAQIVLHGDTMNTTARMLNYCLKENHDLVTSKPLLHMVELPAGLRKQEIGLIKLKGKEEKLALYRLARITNEN